MLNNLQATRQLETQYETNVRLAQDLGVYDAQTYPTLESIGDAAKDGVLSSETLLAISPTTRTVPMVSQEMGKASLISAFSSLDDFGIRQWSGQCVLKTLGSDPIHDRNIDTPFHVALVPAALSEGESAEPVYYNRLTEEQLDVLPDLARVNDTDKPVNFMTVGLYLTVNVLRIRQGLPLLDKERTYTRFPYYPVKEAGYSNYVPAANANPNGVNLQDFSDLAMPYAGIRLVTDIDYQA
jgi:hypothetical protein